VGFAFALVGGQHCCADAGSHVGPNLRVNWGANERYDFMRNFGDRCGVYRRVLLRYLSYKEKLLEESLVTLILKGGGYGGTRIPLLVNLRHHYWTGTNDDFPRNDGIPPLNGGLKPPPPRWKRVIRWFKWVIKGGK
jgi:hypothetical protein